MHARHRSYEGRYQWCVTAPVTVANAAFRNIRAGRASRNYPSLEECQGSPIDRLGRPPLVSRWQTQAFQISSELKVRETRRAAQYAALSQWDAKGLDAA